MKKLIAALFAVALCCSMAWAQTPYGGARAELEEMIESYSSFVEDPANFEILKKALDLGQLTLLEYLTEVKYFLDANYSLLDMKYDYQTKLLELTKYSLLDETGYFE